MARQRRLALTAVVITALGLTATPLHAEPDHRDQGGEIRTTVESVPLTDDLLRQLKSGKLPSEATLDTAQAQVGGDMSKRPPLTPEQIEKAKQPGGYTYTVDSSEYAVSEPVAASPVTVDDPVTPKECTEAYTSGYEGKVWFKNRFASCRGQGIEFTKTRCTNSGCTVIARMAGALTITYNMAPKARAMDIGFQFITLTPGPNYPTSGSIDIRAACWAVSRDSDAKCKGYTTPAPNENIVSAVNTIAEWRRIEVEIVNRVDFIGFDPVKNPGSPIAKEKRTFFYIDPIVAEMESPGIPGDNALYMPTNYHRCDEGRTLSSGSYVRGSDCVFHKASGIFQLSKSDPRVAESAQFILDAQKNITKTAPGTPGSYVPGQFNVTEPLTRLYYDKKQRRANHRRSRRQCESTYGSDYKNRPDGQANQCDEYPFQSTYQGSSTVNESTFPRSFAVRTVLAEHNELAGSRLATWYAEDHILDGGPFFVEIVP